MTAEKTFVGVHVLVAAAGEIDDHEVGRLELGQAFEKTREGVRGFERGNDAFDARQQPGGFKRGLIGDGGVFGAMLIGVI